MVLRQTVPSYVPHFENQIETGRAIVRGFHSLALRADLGKVLGLCPSNEVKLLGEFADGTCDPKEARSLDQRSAWRVLGGEGRKLRCPSHAAPTKRPVTPPPGVACNNVAAILRLLESERDVIGHRSHPQPLLRRYPTACWSGAQTRPLRGDFRRRDT